LEVDEETAAGEGGKYVVEARQQSDALAPERIGLTAVGGVAVADIERLQIDEVLAPGLARAFGAAIDGPVVQHREAVVGGGMHVEFDDVGAGGERGLHGGQGV